MNYTNDRPARGNGYTIGQRPKTIEKKASIGCMTEKLVEIGMRLV